MMAEQSESTAEPRVRMIVSDIKNLRSYFNWKDFLSALIFGLGKRFYNTTQASYWDTCGFWDLRRFLSHSAPSWILS